MITVKQLKERLDNYPDDAIIYIESNHGQKSEQAGFFIDTASFDGFLPYYGDELDWGEGDDTIRAVRIS